MDESLPVLPGYVGVEWADGVVHVIDLATLPDEGPLWRAGVVCDSAGPGVSSDEGGPYALWKSKITCMRCISIIG